MNQITFIKELDALGLCICSSSIADVIGIFKGHKYITEWPAALKDLTYQNRIDIIRECKRELG